MPSELIKIGIPNWSKYNPRSDRSNFTWFRFQNDLLQDPKVFGLTNGQKLLLIQLLCESSKKNTEKFETTARLIASMVGASAEQITGALQVLEDAALITVDGIATPNSRRDDGKHPRKGAPTNERTNVIRNELTTTKVVVGAELQTSPPPFKNPKKNYLTLEKLLIDIPRPTVEMWTTLYEDETFIRNELIKAWDYYVVRNPRKKPRSLRGWLNKLSPWMDRGWIRLTNSEKSKGTIESDREQWEQKKRAESQGGG